MSSFYLTLPSNSSMNYYPNNTLANYVTNLPHSFNFPGEWEVGPSEIQFPISWYNVTDRESHMFLQFVIDPTVVGDFKVPLLRSVNIDGRKGLIVSRIYQNIQYVPLHRKQFDTIEIDIRDDVGRKVPFERGKVIVTLYFRLRKPAYF